MFNKNKFYGLIISAFVINVANAQAVSVADASANVANLSLNVSSQSSGNTVPSGAKELVSPSQAKIVPNANSVSVHSEKTETIQNPSANAQQGTPNTLSANVVNKDNSIQKSSAEIRNVSQQPQISTQNTNTPQSLPKEDFDFDLKMKSLEGSSQSQGQTSKEQDNSVTSAINDADLPKDIQYKANPVESLGNSILSQMDSDLFSQMSEIEKSTTLLTLELRREKIRNEIEAQKAIRQKNIDDQARLKEEQKLKDLERKKKIEAQVLQEKQALLDKERLFEVLKQRKLLNAYMNQMLVNQQEWLKEKESLYAQISALEGEKKELIELFKERINKVLEASAKNIQVAEAARANFERIVKNLKARNEQLRKRVEADAQIIKNVKNNLYLKSQSIQELKDKNASAAAALAANAATVAPIDDTTEVIEEDVPPVKLSAQYAILGITGRAGNMSVDVIDINGQPLSLTVGSPLPTGHILSEIGSDYAKFSRDGSDDYLYVGRSIDGYVPTLGLTDEKKKK